MKVSLSDEALADATQAADWYIDQGAWTAAVALQVEIADALARIAAEPGLFWASAWPDLIVGLGILAMNADAAREVLAAARRQGRAVDAEA